MYGTSLYMPIPVIYIYTITDNYIPIPRPPRADNNDDGGYTEHTLDLQPTMTTITAMTATTLSMLFLFVHASRSST